MNLRINDVLIFLSNQFSVKSEPSINTRAKPAPDDEITKEKDKLENRIMVIKSMMRRWQTEKDNAVRIITRLEILFFI